MTAWRILRASRGQSLAELAAILPIFLILVLGVVDYGRVYFAYVAVTNAARNGAQYASDSPTAADDLDAIRDAALTETTELLQTSPTNPDVDVTIGTDTQGNGYADVAVHYTFTTLFPWPGLPTSFDVERTVRARISEWE